MWVSTPCMRPGMSGQSTFQYVCRNYLGCPCHYFTFTTTDLPVCPFMADTQCSSSVSHMILYTISWETHGGKTCNFYLLSNTSVPHSLHHYKHPRRQSAQKAHVPSIQSYALVLYCKKYLALHLGKVRLLKAVTLS
jgi:hypothetical protein